MLKCYVKGDPPAVFPKERSVLLLTAVVLLLCCCLFVPAAAADITLDDVEVNVSGDSCCEISPHPTEKNTYYITVADYVGTGTDLDYYFSVNVTSPLVGEGVVSVEWTKYILWGWGYSGFYQRSNDIFNGDSLTSTTVAVHSPAEPLSSGEAPYYTAEIIVDGSSSLTLTFYVSTHILIKPMDLTIYANQSSDFPVPRYEYRYEIDRSVFKVDGKDFCFGYENDKYPFTINYYNVTTGYKVICPAEPGTYRAVIEPVDGQDLSEISIIRQSYEYPLLYAEGTLTILPTTENVMLSPSTSPDTVPAGNKDIFAYIWDCTYGYLNGGYDSKYAEQPEHSVHDTVYFLQDDPLDDEEALLTKYLNEYYLGYDAEMKYFDLVVDNIWVNLDDGSSSSDFYWPYPEGTDKNTEFMLLYFQDTRRSLDVADSSDVALIHVDNYDKYIHFDRYADRSDDNFAGLYALIWSDQKPVPTPPSGGGSSDGNMDNAFRVLFNDGSTTLFVVTDLSYGDKLTKPEDPVKDGYTFAGWHKDAACTQAWDFADGIAGDMTLYAKWTPVQTVTPTVTPTATASVTPTVTAEPTGLPTTTPTVQPTGEDDGDKPAGSVLPLIGGILILILAVLLLLFLLLRHTVTFLIPAGGEITEHRIKVWHGRYIDPADLPELLRTAVWYRDPARQERWDFNEDRVTKSIELYLG